MPRQLFDLSELAGTEEIQSRHSDLIAERYLRVQSHKVSSLKELVKKLPDPDEIYFIWTVGSFTGFSFIPLIIEECGTIEELTLATYSINKRVINALMKLIQENKILKVYILISDALPYQLPKVFEHLKSVVSKSDKIEIRYGWNHAKISCIRSGDSKFVVEGSGNWGENAQHEQYIFTRSEKIYEYRKNEIYGAHGETKSRYRANGGD